MTSQVLHRYRFNESYKNSILKSNDAFFVVVRPYFLLLVARPCFWNRACLCLSFLLSERCLWVCAFLWRPSSPPKSHVSEGGEMGFELSVSLPPSACCVQTKSCPERSLSRSDGRLPGSANGNVSINCLQVRELSVRCCEAVNVNTLFSRPFPGRAVFVFRQNILFVWMLPRTIAAASRWEH